MTSISDLPLLWFHNYRYSLKTIIADFIVELFHKFQSSLPVNAIYNYTLYRANPGHKFTYPWSCDFHLIHENLCAQIF